MLKSLEPYLEKNKQTARKIMLAVVQNDTERWKALIEEFVLGRKELWSDVLFFILANNLEVVMDELIKRYDCTMAHIRTSFTGLQLKLMILRENEKLLERHLKWEKKYYKNFVSAISVSQYSRLSNELEKIVEHEVKRINWYRGNWATDDVLIPKSIEMELVASSYYICDQKLFPEYVKALVNNIEVSLCIKQLHGYHQTRTSKCGPDGNRVTDEQKQEIKRKEDLILKEFSKHPVMVMEAWRDDFAAMLEFVDIEEMKKNNPECFVI